MSDAPKPPEPSHQPDQDVDEPPVDAEASKPVPGRRGRTVAIVLAAVLGTLAVLCAGGIGAAYFFYQRASEPDRSTPGVVVRQYLQATFDDRDKSRAARFTCGAPTHLNAIEHALADIMGREQQFKIRIMVGWENFEAEQGKETATVTTRLKIAVPEQSGQSSESFQRWNFGLRHETSGWRVCDAKRAG